MKSKYILLISVGCIVLGLGIVVGLLYWQGHYFAFPIRGNEIEVGLVPESGVHVAGRYYASPGKVENRGVVLLHSLGTSQDIWNDMAAELQKQNLEVITLDFRGHGGSSGDWKKMSADDYSKFVDDAAEGVHYLRDIDADMHIAVVGVSLGANVAMKLADRDPNISAVALVSPQLEYHGLKITKNVRHFTRPIYFTVGQGDTASYDATQVLYSAVPALQKKLDVYDTTDHGIALVRHSKKFAPQLVSWLNMVL